MQPILSETRFGTASVLGFLSVLFHSSTAAVLPIYIFIVLVNIFSGFVLLSRRFGCNRLLSLAAGLFAVIGGWTPNALNIGGLDNLLFLSLFPFLVVRLELYRFGSKSWSTSLGLCDSGCRCVLCVSGRSDDRGRHFPAVFLRVSLVRYVSAGRSLAPLLDFSLSGPGFHFSVRPGVLYSLCSAKLALDMSKGAAGIFPGLLSPRFLPAMFAFGQEYPGRQFTHRTTWCCRSSC